MNDRFKNISCSAFFSKKAQTSLANFVLLLLMVFTLSACNTDLYEGLSEKQANEMLSALLKNGIEAKKISQGKNGFTIAVEEEKLVQSLDILKEHNLPGEGFQNLGDIFKGGSMIASPTEESARMAYAISQELSNTFSRIDGVLTSRVHIVLASTDQANNTATPASAAIFIRHIPESTVTNYIAQLRDITEKAVPDLSLDNISIMLMPVRESISTPRTESPTFLAAFFQVVKTSPLVFILLLITSIGSITYLGRAGMQYYTKFKENKADISEK